jgi:hypothetical protein
MTRIIHPPWCAPPGLFLSPSLSTPAPAPLQPPFPQLRGRALAVGASWDHSPPSACPCAPGHGGPGRPRPCPACPHIRKRSELRICTESLPFPSLMCWVPVPLKTLSHPLPCLFFPLTATPKAPGSDLLGSSQTQGRYGVQQPDGPGDPEQAQQQWKLRWALSWFLELKPRSTGAFTSGPRGLCFTGQHLCQVLNIDISGPRMSPQ